MTQNIVNYGVDMSGSELLDNYISKSQENALTLHSGIQRPPYAKEGTMWLDTSSTPWMLKVYDGTDDTILGSIDSSANRFIPSDPLTTTGDLIVEGEDGKPTRLAAGTAGYVLTSNGAGQIPSYQLGTYMNTDLGNITSEGNNYISNIVKQIVNSIYKVGDIKSSVINVNHDNWFLCNGQAISRAEYPNLFALIGTNFGAGNGSTTFNLPDYRGKFLRGLGGNSASNIYTTQAEGLPNIVGSLSPTIAGSRDKKTAQRTGAFTGSDVSNSQKVSDYPHRNPDSYSYLYFNNNSLVFDASKSNSIYGASEHVTPINQAVNYFIKVKEEE